MNDGYPVIPHIVPRTGRWQACVFFYQYVGADQKVRFRHCEPLGEAIQSIDFQLIASGFALAMTCKIPF
ncbi:MAG: hypothetical protein LBN71_08305, partial [Tannerella sp.]|nr:hypothetical protein [Tannerella sp.]